MQITRVKVFNGHLAINVEKINDFLNNTSIELMDIKQLPDYQNDIDTYVFIKVKKEC
jgi:hypothetical protein